MLDYIRPVWVIGLQAKAYHTKICKWRIKTEYHVINRMKKDKLQFI
jgi:hypothetical protein